MRIRRRLPIPLAVVLVIAAIALIVTLRKHAPPEPARLLPGADGFFYVNLEWIRKFNATGQLPPVSRDPEYQKFVEETGFQFERDLDKVALAIHYPQSWGGGTGESAPEPRISWVFVGKIDAARLTTYLKKLSSSSIDNYRGFDIYNIPLEGRTVRVVLLSYDAVAVSNHPNPDVIRGIVDRSRKLASPFGGPSLLRRFYGKVPLASLSFAILRVVPEASTLGGLGTWSLLFPKPTVVVISARYFPGLHLRAEAFTGSEEDARAITEKTTAFLSIFHAAEGSMGAHGTDPDAKAFFDSLKIDRSGNRAILTATVPQGFIKKVLTEAPADAVAPTISPKAPAAPDRPAKPEAPKSGPS